MEHLFTLNPDVKINDIKEAIHDLLSKIKSVLTCIIFATEFVKEEVELDNQILFGALHAADDYLDELTQLFQRLEKLD